MVFALFSLQTQTLRQELLHDDCLDSVEEDFEIKLLAFM